MRKFFSAVGRFFAGLIPAVLGVSTDRGHVLPASDPEPSPPLPLPCPPFDPGVNLLTLTGDAVLLRSSPDEVVNRIDVSISLHNLDQVNPVVIRHAESYTVSPGGWLTRLPQVLVFADATSPTGVSGNFLGIDPSIAPASIATATRTFINTTQPSHVLFLIRASMSAGGILREQNLLAQLPVTVTPATAWEQWVGAPTPPPPPAAPLPLPIKAPVFIMLQGELHAIPVGDGSKMWLPVTGEVVNGTGGAIQITTFRYRVGIADGRRGLLVDDIPLLFSSNPGGGVVNDIDMTAAPSNAQAMKFSFAIDLPTGKGDWSSFVLELCVIDALGKSFLVSRSADILNGTTTIASFIAPVTRQPGKVWTSRNGPQQSGFNRHNRFFDDRFANDILLLENGTNRPAATAANENNSYHAYGKEIVAMADGVVIASHDTETENAGNAGGSSGYNFVWVLHSNNVIAEYGHLVPGSAKAAGSNVNQGDALGRLGNAGFSTDPHLHLSCWRFDEETGAIRFLPLAFSNIGDANGNPLPGVLTHPTDFTVR